MPLLGRAWPGPRRLRCSCPSAAPGLRAACQPPSLTWPRHEPGAAVRDHLLLAVVPGAGAFEVAAARHLRTKTAKGVEGRAKLGIEAFAEVKRGPSWHRSSVPAPGLPAWAACCAAPLPQLCSTTPSAMPPLQALLGLPKILAENSGYDPQDCIIALQVCAAGRGAAGGGERGKGRQELATWPGRGPGSWCRSLAPASEARSAWRAAHHRQQAAARLGSRAKHLSAARIGMRAPSAALCMVCRCTAGGGGAWRLRGPRCG